MTASELIGLIPKHIFSELSAETKVDYQVKKLTGEVMFKLILFSMLSTNKLSLRVMEALLQSCQFKAFCNHKQSIPESRFNSLRDRICTINAAYFDKLFKDIFSIYNKELKEQKALSKVDSTYVTLSAKLLSTGMKNGPDEGKRQLKYSVVLKGSLPAAIKVFTEATYINEGIALAELINETDCLKGDVVVFDRGIQSRNSFDHFTTAEKLFIGRSKTHIYYKEVAVHPLTDKPKDATLTLTHDSHGYLFNEKRHAPKHLYRVIRGVLDKVGEEICFVTNILDEEAHLIAQWYKQRWEIEVFFKFIKQHLSATHLVSRTLNGVKVMIYMTMITAVLLLAYKKINKLQGYKIAKLRSETELEADIIKAIVLLCGGDPNKAPQLFASG
jgi:hypothetical protein